MESGDTQSNIGRMNAAFAANYRTVQYHYVQFLSEHLVDCSRTFEGDFDQVVILAVMGQRALDAVRQVAEDVEAVSGAFWMSAMRIADVTGLPRETVRRKLKSLEARGWVKQETSKGWALVTSEGAAPIRQALGGLDKRGLARLSKLIVSILLVLDESEDG